MKILVPTDFLVRRIRIESHNKLQKNNGEIILINMLELPTSW
jgi:hypothetical protein